MVICIYSRMLWRVIRWIAINCKVPLCHANERNPPKTFPLHFSPATKGPADIMSVILSLTQVWVLTRTSLEITLSCWLSSNNRLEASKGGWCLESLFFLCQPWLPASKHVPLIFVSFSNLLATTVHYMSLSTDTFFYVVVVRQSDNYWLDFGQLYQSAEMYYCH